MLELTNDRPFIRLLASDQRQVEGEALRQLEKSALLDGMEVALGLPDLHPGAGNPVGAAFLSKQKIYPHIVGSDVGCGIGLWKTSLKANKVKRDKWVKKLKGFEDPWDGDVRRWLADWGLDSTDFDAALGTIGAGNHFAELQMIERIYCRGSFKALGLDKLSFYLLVHSGSRGMGASLLRRHTERFGAGGLVAGSEEALQAYKNIDAVINDMQRAGLIRVVATLLLKGAQAAGGVIYPNMSEDWDAMPTRFRNTLRRR